MNGGEGRANAGEGEGAMDGGRAPGSGLSFTFQKKSRAPRVLEGSGDKGRGGEREEKDFVLSLEGKEIQSTRPKQEKKEFVVPMISVNVWRMPAGREKGKGSDERIEKSAEEIALDKEAAEAIMRDLHEAQVRASESGNEGPVVPLLMQNKPPAVEGREDDELADVELRPDVSTVEDYEAMPIDQFGAAMLRGMGWKKGDPVGKSNKGLVEPIEFIPRLTGLGLGATGKRPETKPGRIRKPGEVERKVIGPYIDKDGRVRHVKKVGEEIPSQQNSGFATGNYARVLRGPHENLYGKIISLDEDNSRVMLKLTINSQIINFSRHYLELVSEDEHKQYGRESGGKEYGLIKKKRSPLPTSESKDRVSVREESSVDGYLRGKKREQKEGQSVSSKRTKHDEEDSRHLVARSKGHKRAREKSKGEDGEKKAKHSLDGSKSEIRVRTSDGSPYHSRAGEGYRKTGSSTDGGLKLKGQKPWIVGNLRVRLVDRKFRKGVYYNQKVVIIDVVSLDKCICQTADGKLLEDVSQSMLETIVPKTPQAAVMVVRGKHKGQVATVLERDSSKYQAVVELMQTKEVLKLDYDDICEYVGTVEDVL